MSVGTTNKKPPGAGNTERPLCFPCGMRLLINLRNIKYIAFSMSPQGLIFYTLFREEDVI